MADMVSALAHRCRAQRQTLSVRASTRTEARITLQPVSLRAPLTEGRDFATLGEKAKARIAAKA
jgi:hypothetical protein